MTTAPSSGPTPAPGPHQPPPPAAPGPHQPPPPAVAEPQPPPVSAVPTATYRLQLQPDFPFAAAEAAVPYLAALGISHLHLSPVLEAVPGSTHGYDVVDHTRIRAELGGEAGLRALSRTARAHGLGLIVDIVPNHMAVPVPEYLNAPLWRVLQDGPGSAYARWFDIDWDAQGGRMLLPVLGARLGEELDALKTEGPTADGEPALLRYHDHVLPLRPGTEQLPLPELLAAQYHRPAWWRLARTELNYRRFFTISELIGVRVEDREVFEATHAAVFRMLDEKVVHGLRVDHPDGLADPAGYLGRLAERTGRRWTVVEKILCGAEQLPADWACAGTTGYDALRHIDGVFIDPGGTAELASGYRDSTGVPPDLGGEWAPTARRAAHETVGTELAAEVERLGRTADRICAAAGPALADHAPWALRAAIRELLVRLPVYRPYPGSAASAAMLESAAALARRAFAVPAEAHSVDVVADLALRRPLGPADAGGAAEPAAADRADFAARFAQTAAALHAKSVEDTAFYRYIPLLSLNEVGGDPGCPGIAPAAFHLFCGRLQRDWPATGTVLSTHDTKRSADVRARTAVLAELPVAWQELLAELTGQVRVRAPDPHAEWLVWQTALGLDSPNRERLTAAVLKAVREAGLHTSWTEPDPAYEQAVAAFVAAGPCGPPGRTLAAFNRRIDDHAAAGSLGAALLHLTMPGVPDLYQGTEGAYAALVDPDNRPPARLPAGPAFGLPGEPGADCRAHGLDARKRHLTAVALRLRRRRPQWFGADSGYEPLAAQGPAARHCLAFARAGQVVTAVTRLPVGLERGGGWRGTLLPLPPGRWRDLLCGREFTGQVRLAELFDGYPVALLAAG